ncbi:glycosyltransferase [uncultured Caulobacter sp.]|uniref:glycosyltransferase n=1 Tax=uncultured Caulobacter sp. TaxID=158749 RepID=UPI00263839F4|nr:glycosyltransferase [uncultured Caulobacter sp.]
MTSAEQVATGRGSLLSVNAYHYARGGADIFYLNHAALMERRGWTNTFSSMRHPENMPCEDEAFFVDEIDFERRGSVGKMLADATRVVYSLEAREKIGKLLDTRRIDIAHVHNIYHHQSPSILDELRARRIPIVLTAHDLKLACPAYTMLNGSGVCEKCKGGRLWNVVANRCIKGSVAASGLIMLESAVHKLLKLYSRNVDRIIVPSAFYRQKLIEWGWDPKQITLIRNFVTFPRQADPGSVENGIVYFGRLSPEKGLVTLIRAAKLSGVPVKIIGRGPQLDELRTLVEDLGAPVEFLGFLQGDALWSVVGAARAVVLPSEWYENSPLSVLEAFGRGKPLIGARIGGIPELIEEGVTGWSFESGNVESLAETLRRVSALPADTLRDMARACRTYVESNHSEDVYYAQISDLYDAVMRSPRG